MLSKTNTLRPYCLSWKANRESRALVFYISEFLYYILIIQMKIIFFKDKVCGRIRRTLTKISYCNENQMRMAISVFSQYYFLLHSSCSILWMCNKKFAMESGMLFMSFHPMVLLACQMYFTWCYFNFTTIRWRLLNSHKLSTFLIPLQPLVTINRLPTSVSTERPMIAQLHSFIHSKHFCSIQNK